MFYKKITITMVFLLGFCVDSNAQLIEKEANSFCLAGGFCTPLKGKSVLTYKFHGNYSSKKCVILSQQSNNIIQLFRNAQSEVVLTINGTRYPHDLTGTYILLGSKLYDLNFTPISTLS